ncbi:hypothetical protein H5410_032534, partial [Solanum commersonii]
MSSLLVGRTISKSSYNLGITLIIKLIPKHVAIIMDDNRRWAKARGLAVQEGHKFLTLNHTNICNISSKLGIQVITALLSLIMKTGPIP